MVDTNVIKSQKIVGHTISFDYTHFRLSRSPSSPAISMAAIADSGLWDSSADELDDRTVVFW